MSNCSFPRLQILTFCSALTNMRRLAASGVEVFAGTSLHRRCVSVLRLLARRLPPRMPPSSKHFANLPGRKALLKSCFLCESGGDLRRRSEIMIVPCCCRLVFVSCRMPVNVCYCICILGYSPITLLQCFFFVHLTLNNVYFYLQ